MFCRNCAKEVPDQAEFCLGCGARPLSGNAYCNVCGAPTTPLSELCVKCGSRVSSAGPAAPVPVAVYKVPDPNASPKSRTIMAILAWFTGFVGVHRFYAGRIPSGVAMAVVWVIGLGINLTALAFTIASDAFNRTASLTAFEQAARSSVSWVFWLLMVIGGLMTASIEVWRLVDFVMVLMGKFRDGANRPITRWNNEGPVSTAGVPAPKLLDPNVSPKSRLVTVLLAYFVGFLGIHCFYVGRIGRGVAMLILGIAVMPAATIWAIVDMVFAIIGQFRDSDKKLITDWKV
jgi:TM2 domain-containing membrane protein YozV